MYEEHVPEEISPAVRELCRKIMPDGSREPEFIRITPEPGCDAADCFRNVKEKVDREGGRIQFGWAIWEWPGVFIEGEHHAVYEPASGRPWLDITPCSRSNSKRLFLPDDTATYDFEHEGVLRENVRLALRDDPAIDEFFAAAHRRTEYVNSLPGVGEITIHASESKTLEKLTRRLARATAELHATYGSR